EAHRRGPAGARLPLLRHRRARPQPLPPHRHAGSRRARLPPGLRADRRRGGKRADHRRPRSLRDRARPRRRRVGRQRRRPPALPDDRLDAAQPAPLKGCAPSGAALDSTSTPKEERAMSQKKSGSLDRREMLGLLGGAALAAPVLGASGVALAQSSGEKEKGTAEGELAIAPEPYTLPPLPYPKNALDGYLSAEILELHHDKHHAGYVKGLDRKSTRLNSSHV